MRRRNAAGTVMVRGATILLAVAAIAASLLSVAGPAEAATPAHVQSRAKEITTGTLNSLKFTNGNAAGNLIVVYVAWSNTSTHHHHARSASRAAPRRSPASTASSIVAHPESSV